MSWQAYIDTSLVGSGNVAKGAIFSADGKSVWAVSPGWEIKPEEVKAIVDNWSRTNDSPLLQTGFYIAGEKYVCVKHDEEGIYARHGKEGVVITKSNQALIIAYHNEEQSRFPATAATDALTVYLKSVGY